MQWLIIDLKLIEKLSTRIEMFPFRSRRIDPIGNCFVVFISSKNIDFLSRKLKQ
jgi:hypothetical protein